MYLTLAAHNVVVLKVESMADIGGPAKDSKRQKLEGGHLHKVHSRDDGHEYNLKGTKTTTKSDFCLVDFFTLIR
ncbi:hypothetical protein MKW98_027698 [Papaver atlanticum]|uniref:Uncharacterized protein n=1 Tax=Papaver atlanticum TaxID=357466 RepID=A0AAD4TC04_9MAGN|nr:hypothetical protein MKW98_027698 [Papaver atlanticum]